MKLVLTILALGLCLPVTGADKKIDYFDFTVVSVDRDFALKKNRKELVEGIIALVGELRGLVPSLTPKEELWVKREIENARKSTNFTDYFFKLMAKPEFCTHYFKRDMTLIWNAAQLVLAVNEFGLERGEMALWAKLAVEMNERTKSLDWATPTLIRAKILQDKAKLKNGFMHTMHKEEGHLLNLSRAFGEISESIFAQIITPYLDSLVDEKKDVPAKPKK